MTSIDPVSHEAQLYADAIMRVVDTIAKDLQHGDMNAILGALVAVQAYFIAGIEDLDIRESAQRQAAKLLCRQIAQQIETGETSRTQLTVKKAN